MTDIDSVDRLLADYLLVLRWALAESRMIQPTTIERVYDAVTDFDFPDLTTLRRVLEYVLCELQFTYPTAADHDVRNAARRLWAALDGTCYQ